MREAAQHRDQKFPHVVASACGLYFEVLREQVLIKFYIAGVES
jgi:hypothetical protein